MDKETRNLIIGLVVGGLIAFVSAWAMWAIQIQYENENLAHGIYLDLEKANMVLPLYAHALQNGNVFNISGSFYSSYYLSPTAADLSRFDSKLSNKLYIYYYNLAEAETIRLKLNDPNSIENTNENLHTIALTNMKNDLINCSEMIPSIEALINQEYPKK